MQKEMNKWVKDVENEGTHEHELPWVIFFFSRFSVRGRVGDRVRGNVTGPWHPSPPPPFSFASPLASPTPGSHLPPTKRRKRKQVPQRKKQTNRSERQTSQKIATHQTKERKPLHQTAEARAGVAARRLGARSRDERNHFLWILPIERSAGRPEPHPPFWALRWCLRMPHHSLLSTKRQKKNTGALLCARIIISRASS